MRMRVLGVAMIMLGAFLIAPASAQVGQTELLGTVTDTSGGVLPGVSVTATQVGVGVTRTVVTDSQGRYTFTALPVGRWDLVFQMAGFADARIEGIELNVGQRPTVNVTMEVAGVTETVTVQAETPQIATTRSELSESIQEIQVQQLPVLGRDWLGFAVIAAGIKSDGSETTQDSAPRAGIGIGRQDKVIIDGADVNNRSTSSGVDIKLSKETIAEFEVKTNQFDAQLGQSGTSVTQAITKSGTDQLHGSGFFFFRDDSLNADDFFTGTKSEYRNEQVGGTIGGPIIPGKTHFFFSYEWQNTPRTLSSNTGITLIDQQEVDGSDKRNLWFIRGDHQLTDNHRTSFRYNRATRLQPHAGTGGGTPPGGSQDYDFWFNRYNVSLDSLFGTAWVNRLIFNYLDSNRLFGKRGDVVVGPDVSPKVTTAGPNIRFPSATLGATVGGGFENPDYWSIRDDISVFFEKGGQHNMKFGGYMEKAELQGFFLSQTNGVFFFDQDPPNLQTCCVSETYSEWDRSQFPDAVRYSQNLGEPSINAPQNIYSLYFQDDWTLNDRLTLNLGLRYDYETGSTFNDASQESLLQQPFPSDKDNIQPRIGFAYDLMGDARTILRGGAGRFVSQAFLNIALLVQRSNRPQEINVTVINDGTNPNFNDDPLEGRDFEDFKELIGTVPLDVSIFPPGTEIPDLWSFSFGVAHQLTPSIAIEADYVHQRTNNQFKAVDTNLFYDEETGRNLPVTSGFFPELGGQVVGVGRPDPKWNVIRNFVNEGIARYHGFSVGVNKRFGDNYSFGMTYLLSKNEDNTDDFDDYPSMPFNIGDEYGTSLNDQRHRFTANWVWQMPHNFVFSGLIYGASGRAMQSIAANVDLYSSAPERRGLNPRPTCGLDPRFDAACSVLGVPEGSRVPRNGLRSDAAFRVDVRLGWRGYITNEMFVEPTFEIFNLFNRENYDPQAYSTNLSASNFGRPGRSANQPYLPRQIQLGITFRF